MNTSPSIVLILTLQAHLHWALLSDPGWKARWMRSVLVSRLLFDVMFTENTNGGGARTNKPSRKNEKGRYALFTAFIFYL